MKLTKYKLGDVAEIVPGYAFKASDFGTGDNIALKIKNISPFIVDTEGADRVLYTPSDRFKVKTGDYVMAMTGATIGKVGKILSQNKNIFINQRVCKFIPNESICNKDFLFYVLNTEYFKQFVYNNVDSKVAQPNIGHPTLYKFDIELPDLDTQRRIAYVLSNLDRKIALNRQINTNLEALARQLYDYWFVQFDFPDENGKPYKSSGGKMVYNEKLKRDIPEGWEDGRLADIANITMGQSPDGRSYNEERKGIIFYQGSTDFGERFPDVRQYTTEPSRYAKKGDILMSVRAPVGALNIANNDCCIGRGLAAINSKLGSMTHLYYVMLSFKEIFDRMSDVGTTFGSITKDELYGLPVVKPDVDIIKKYEEKCKPIFEQQMILGAEITSLTRQRDELLPLLMNGQVTIE